MNVSLALLKLHIVIGLSLSLGMGMFPRVGPSLYPGSIKLKAIKTHRLVFLESQKKLWAWTLYDALCVKGQHEGVVHHEVGLSLKNQKHSAVAWM